MKKHLVNYYVGNVTAIALAVEYKHRIYIIGWPVKNITRDCPTFNRQPIFETKVRINDESAAATNNSTNCKQIRDNGNNNL